MWKLTDEDWRNRDKFDLYIETAEEMFEKTNTENAPWFIVHGDDKLHARLTVLTNIIYEIERQLDKRGIEYTLISETVVVADEIVEEMAENDVEKEE